MNTAQWFAGLVVSIDPDAILDYDLYFTDWLNGDTITTVAITATGCTATVLSNTTTGCRIRVQAVAIKGTVKVVINTASGQREEFTITFKARQQ